jgi:hypothetical protein
MHALEPPKQKKKKEKKQVNLNSHLKINTKEGAGGKQKSNNPADYTRGLEL